MSSARRPPRVPKRKPGQSLTHGSTAQRPGYPAHPVPHTLWIQGVARPPLSMFWVYRQLIVLHLRTMKIPQWSDHNPKHGPQNQMCVVVPGSFFLFRIRDTIGAQPSAFVSVFFWGGADSPIWIIFFFPDPDPKNQSQGRGGRFCGLVAQVPEGRRYPRLRGVWVGSGATKLCDTFSPIPPPHIFPNQFFPSKYQSPCWLLCAILSR